MLSIKQKSERSSSSITNDKKYLFNMCLCYYYLYAEDQVSIAMKIPQKRKEGTNQIISVELVLNQNGMVFDKDKIYRQRTERKNKVIEYNPLTKLPIVDGEHKSNSKDVQYSNKCIFSALILDKLKETEFFKNSFDSFWKCYINEEERCTSDYSQIVNLPRLLNKKNPGMRLENGDSLRFIDKKDYLQTDAEIILASFTQQFQLNDENMKNSPVYLIISDSIENQNRLIKEIDEKSKHRNIYRFITRQDMINYIEMKLLQYHFPSMEFEERVTNSEPVSPTTSILHSEETQHYKSVFQPTSSHLYIVYEGYTPVSTPFNPFWGI